MLSLLVEDQQPYLLFFSPILNHYFKPQDIILLVTDLERGHGTHDGVVPSFCEINKGEIQEKLGK